MGIRLNNRELERQLCSPYIDVVLYLFLRSRMDFRTGLVGCKTRISYQALSEALYIEPGQGKRGTGSPSRSRIRRALGRMCRQGLIIPRGTPGQLIFELPLADYDFSASNKVSQKWAKHLDHPKHNTKDVGFSRHSNSSGSSFEKRYEKMGQLDLEEVSIPPGSDYEVTPMSRPASR